MVARRSSSKLVWNGDAVEKRLRTACKQALNTVARDIVVEFKGNHPGWENRSFNAQNSVRVVEPASESLLRARLGSQNVIYFLRLEFEHGAALRNAFASKRLGLKDEIRRRYKQIGG